MTKSFSKPKVKGKKAKKTTKPSGLPAPKADNPKHREAFEELLNDAIVGKNPN